MPKRKQPTVVKVSLIHAMELSRLGYADISSGEVKLTPAGRKAIGKTAVGVRLVINGVE